MTDREFQLERQMSDLRAELNETLNRLHEAEEREKIGQKIINELRKTNDELRKALCNECYDKSVNLMKPKK